MRHLESYLIIALLLSTSCGDETGPAGHEMSKEDQAKIIELEMKLSNEGNDLCGFLKELEIGEDDNAEKADEEHPGFGPEHGKMVRDMNEELYNSIKTKYSLSDTDLTFLTVTGLARCR